MFHRSDGVTVAAMTGIYRIWLELFSRFAHGCSCTVFLLFSAQSLFWLELYFLCESHGPQSVRLGMQLKSVAISVCWSADISGHMYLLQPTCVCAVWNHLSVQPHPWQQSPKLLHAVQSIMVLLCSWSKGPYLKEWQAISVWIEVSTN